MKERKAAIGVLIGCLIVMIATVVAGCAKDAEVDTDADEGGMTEIQLSFVNEEYVLSGSGEPFTEVVLEFAPEKGNPYASVLAQLGNPTQEGLSTMLTSAYKINSAQVYFGGIVTVDFSSEGLSGGSMQEYLMISQIVRTLYFTFPAVNGVQFTVDGNMAETLMGHMDITSPYVVTFNEDDPGHTYYDVEMAPKPAGT